MTYALIGFIVFVGLRLWLTATVRKAVVQPVLKDGTMIGPLLSEKTRWTMIRENYGLMIGFVGGLTLGILLMETVGLCR
jgi:hypothetical protein